MSSSVCGGRLWQWWFHRPILHTFHIPCLYGFYGNDYYDNHGKVLGLLYFICDMMRIRLILYMLSCVFICVYIIFLSGVVFFCSTKMSIYFMLGVLCSICEFAAHIRIVCLCWSLCVAIIFVILLTNILCHFEYTKETKDGHNAYSCLWREQKWT